MTENLRSKFEVHLWITQIIHLFESIYSDDREFAKQIRGSSLVFAVIYLFENKAWISDNLTF